MIECMLFIFLVTLHAQLVFGFHSILHNRVTRPTQTSSVGMCTSLRLSQLCLRGSIIEVGDEDTDSDCSDPLSTQKGEIMAILREVVDPETLDDIVTAGYVRSVQMEKATGSDAMDILVKMQTGDPSSSFSQEIKNMCLLKLATLEWTGGIKVSIEGEAGGEEQSGSKQGNMDIEEKTVPQGMKDVKKIVAVSSCKGGVGKSTTSVNLAYTLAAQGYKVGILDADIYGPSLPTMTSPTSQELSSDPVSGMLYPQVCPAGVKLVSMGWINKGAAIMRGPMVNQVLQQFVGLCAWGELDFLVVDMPPGTGDIQLTLAQIVEIDAAVVVTTPQRLSFVDVVKGIDLFDTVNIPCVAVVENMAEQEAYEFPSPSFYEELAVKVRGMAGRDVAEIQAVLKASIEGQKQPRKIFGHGYSSRMINMWGITNIVSLPLLSSMSAAADKGTPYVQAFPDSEVAASMRSLADSVVREISRMESVEHKVNFDTVKDEIQYSGSVEDKEIPNGMRDVDIAVKPFDLRADCKCALCVEEMTGKPLLDIFTLPPDVKPVSMAPIGRYAISVDWSDGHKSLYPFRQIAKLGEKFSTVA